MGWEQKIPSRVLSAGLLIACTVSKGWAQAAPSLESILTYPEFEELVRQKVSQVPELLPLWIDAPPDGVDPPSIFFGGGVFRGLMQRIHRDLLRGGLEWARGQKVPGVAQLALQRDSDMDLLAPDVARPILKQMHQYRDWDVLTRSFFASSIHDGGTGFDRLYANPWRITDSLGGLKDFYHGRMVFHSRRESGFELAGNTSTALALRFLRIAKEFEGQLAVSSASLSRIQEDVHAELLPRNDSERVSDPNSTRYWVKKALRKFFIAHEDDIAQAFITLKETGLLAKLAKNYYPLPTDLHLDFYQLAVSLESWGFREDEIAQVARMACWNLRGCIKLHEYFVDRMNGFDDVLDFFRGYALEPSPAYLQQIGLLFSDRREVFARHFRSLEDVLLIRRELGTAEAYRVFLEIGFSKVRNVKDLFKLMDTFGLRLPFDEMNRGLLTFLEGHVQEIFAYTKTVRDVQVLIESCRSPETMGFILSEGLKRVTRPLGFFMLLDHDRDLYRYGAELQKKSDEIILTSRHAFKNLNPSEADWRELESRFFNHRYVRQLRELHLGRDCSALVRSLAKSG